MIQLDLSCISPGAARRIQTAVRQTIVSELEGSAKLLGYPEPMATEHRTWIEGLQALLKQVIAEPWDQRTSTYTLRHMPSTPMSQQEMEAQCRLVSSVAGCDPGEEGELG